MFRHRSNPQRSDGLDGMKAKYTRLTRSPLNCGQKASHGLPSICVGGAGGGGGGGGGGGNNNKTLNVCHPITHINSRYIMLGMLKRTGSKVRGDPQASCKCTQLCETRLVGQRLVCYCCRRVRCCSKDEHMTAVVETSNTPEHSITSSQSRLRSFVQSNVG